MVGEGNLLIKCVLSGVEGICRGKCLLVLPRNLTGCHFTWGRLGKKNVSLFTHNIILFTSVETSSDYEACPGGYSLIKGGMSSFNAGEDVRLVVSGVAMAMSGQVCGRQFPPINCGEG